MKLFGTDRLLSSSLGDAAHGEWEAKETWDTLSHNDRAHVSHGLS